MFEISIRTDTRPGRRVGCLSLRVTESVSECVCVWFPQPNNTYATNSIRARTKKIKFPLQQYCENNGFFVYDGRKKCSMYTNAVIPHSLVVVVVVAAVVG